MNAYLAYFLGVSYLDRVDQFPPEKRRAFFDSTPGHWIRCYEKHLTKPEALAKWEEMYERSKK